MPLSHPGVHHCIVHTLGRGHRGKKSIVSSDKNLEKSGSKRKSKKKGHKKKSKSKGGNKRKSITEEEGRK